LSWCIFIRSLRNWMTHNWEQRCKSQTNSRDLCIQLSIKIDSISLPLMIRGFIYQQITKLSRCGTVNRSWNRKAYNSDQKWCSQSHRILSRFTLSMSFWKEKYLMQRTISNISWNQFLLCVQNLGGIVSSFMQTMPVLI
jgi:hypothetical protein